ncbi:type II secretion system protein [Thioalkalivibrio nitratireducens DSM 14787]|uniref:Type II secretion system protein n=1 Tax=Thioalkalivibrio nitratireducens (strain DSM 14787 / UNIQEM 213 / ALEN2) TaxID=1255043 RepID=L0E0H7_THIND|nr:type II secretion system F family protein [Thioalkalivibrio nitratireducens]AGA34141.1 type II secretion system protein [Thioalkalivibrio nitratireducens DSM 14787]
MDVDAWWLALVSLALVAFALGLLGWGLVRRVHEDELIGRRIGGVRGQGGAAQGLARLGSLATGMRPAVSKRAPAFDPAELSRLLAQAGYPRPVHRRVFVTVANVLPVAVGLLGFLWLSASGQLEARPLAGLAMVTILAVLLPKRVLGVLAARRQARIGHEAGLFVQLLRLLLEAGLSLEHALRVIATEARTLLPDTAQELELVLQRVEAGQELAEALDEMSHALQVPEIEDAAPILRQFVQQGGGVRGPLKKLSDLILDRQETRSQEKISKMAAKMSVVMMVFLFPALLAFLAAPGLMALGRGLMGVGDG